MVTTLGAGVAGAAAGLGAGTVTDCPAEADDNGGTGADKPLEIRLLLAAGGVLVAGATTVVAATDPVVNPGPLKPAGIFNSGVT